MLFIILGLIFLPVNVYADTVTVAYDFEDVAIVGENFEYTIKGFAGLDEKGSSNLDGTIAYDEDVFELVEVKDNPLPEVLDVVALGGKIEKEVSHGQISFNYVFEGNYESFERVDLTFVF